MTPSPSHLDRSGRCARFLAVDPGPPRGPGGFRRIAVEVVWMARFFYLFVFFLMNTRLGIHRCLRRGDPTDPVWPTAC